MTPEQIDAMYSDMSSHLWLIGKIIFWVLTVALFCP